MTLTGFAVDYVVHLAHSYMESASASSLDRTHDALRDMGISVFFGMATSLCAAFALSRCQFVFLSRFGVFFVLTISFAYLWSVLFLMPLLATVGPYSAKSAEEVEKDRRALGSWSTFVVDTKAADETDKAELGEAANKHSSATEDGNEIQPDLRASQAEIASLRDSSSRLTSSTSGRVSQKEKEKARKKAQRKSKRAREAAAASKARGSAVGPDIDSTRGSDIDSIRL